MDDELNDRERLRWEKRLLSRARAGEREAFAELYRAYAGLVFSRVLVPRLGNRAAAEDALSETFRTALERLGTYESHDVSVYFWFCRIAMNKATDMHRAKGTTGRALANFEALLGPLREDSVEPESALSERREIVSLRKAVTEVLGRMNPRYGEAIRLRFLEERSREDCAEALDVKLGTFDVLLLRALRAFRKEWTAMTEEEA